MAWHLPDVAGRPLALNEALENISRMEMYDDISTLVLRNARLFVDSDGVKGGIVVRGSQPKRSGVGRRGKKDYRKEGSRRRGMGESK